MRRLLLLVALLLWGGPPVAFAEVLEENLQRIRHFTKLDGLSHNSVFCLAQDQRGMIWAGTKNGLNRYDGYSFRVFRNLQPEGPVWNDHIEALTVWGDSLLLVAHRGGFSYVNVFTLKWKHVLLPKPRKSENLRRVYSIQPINAFQIFVSGAMGVYQYDIRKPKTIKFITDVVANRFLTTNSGKYHYFSAFTGLYQLHKSTFKVERVYLNAKAPIQGPLLELKDGSILSGGWANGLIKFDPITQKTTPINLIGNHGRLKKDFISFQFFELPDGRIAITSHNHGVITVNPDNWTANLLHAPESQFNIQYTIEVYGLLVDKQGMLWISTDQGLSVLSTKEHFLKRVPIRYHSKNPANADFYQIQVVNKEWAIGVGYSGAYAISQINGKCWLINNDHKLTQGAIFNCFNMEPGAILLTGYMGLIKMKIKYSSTDTLIFYSPECRHSALKSYLALQLDPNRYILGTVGSQVMYYHWEKDSLSIRTAQDLKLSDFNFSGGGVGVKKIWFNIHHNGLGQLDSNTLRWTSFPFPGDYGRAPFDRPTLSSVKEMHNGNLWVGTEENGLWYFNNQKRTWNHLTNNQGIPHSRVLHIFSDNDQNVWVQTNTGFLVYQNQQLNALKLINVFDGIEDEENLTNSILFGQNLVFADLKYLYSLSLPLFFKKKTPPMAGVSSIRINGKEVNDNLQRTYSLKTNESTFEIDLTSGSFDEINKVRYAYRLANKSNQWLKLSQGRTITLSYLPPGEYELEFAARFEGEKNGKSSQVKILIQAPFYTTWWFYTLAIIFFCCLGLVYWHIRQKRKRELEHVRQRIASDLHDDLGATLSSVNILAELAKRKPQEASELLSKIGDSTQEMMERVSDIVWSIKPDNDALPELVSRMRAFSAQTLEAMGVELIFQVKGDLQQLVIPMETRQQLYLLFKEIVNNAAKHAHASEMLISLELDGKMLTITFADNGNGFDPNQLRNGGNGLMNIRQRAELIHAGCTLVTAPNKGTTWVINIKQVA